MDKIRKALQNKKLVWCIIGGIIVLSILLYMIVSGTSSKTLDVKLNESDIKMVVEDKYQLYFVETDTNKKVDDSINWSIGNKEIANIENDGNVIAKSEGSTIVTASYKNEKYECKISVENLQFEVPENLEIKIDETKLLEVKTNSKSLVSFESKDSSIITVDDKGNLKGIKEGSTEITVKLNDTTKICKLTVVKSETSNEVNNDSSTGSYSPEQPTNGGSTSSNNGSTTTNKKPNSNTGSSSNKPSNGGSTANKPSNGGSTSGGGSSTPAPTPKPDPTPTPPKPEVSYSYMGRQVYDWVIGKGGKDIGGSAYLGNPDKNGYGGVSTIDFMAKVQNVGTKNTDYIITLNSGILTEGYMPEIMNNCFENGSTVRSNILSGRTSFAINGRNYSAQSSRFGYVINVSAKAN